jgi:hypothetical protein
MIVRTTTLISATGLVMSLLAPTAIADAPACSVRNVTQDVRYESDDGSALTDAITASAADDHLRVRGTCTGTYLVDHDLEITATPDGPYPVLDGGASGTVVKVTDEAKLRLHQVFVVNGSDSALVIMDGSAVRARRVRLQDSTSPDDGGLVHNHGRLTLIDAIVEHGSASQVGGGILNTGTLRATRTDLRFNEAGTQGGGLFNNGRAVLVDSIVSNNHAGIDGGGIFNGRRLRLDNTVVAGNTPNDCSGC